MQPNLLCISIDSLRGDYCSFLESDLDTTPFLSEIADQATVYESAITPSTWTLPVHTSIFSGLFPPEHNILTGDEVLGNQPTFAEVLRDAGYETRAFYENAWLDTADIIRGFDIESEESDSTSGPSLKRKFADGVARVSPYTEILLERSFEGVKTYKKWLGQSAAESGKDTYGENDIDSAISETDGTEQPFCWFVHLNEAHWKYDPPKPYHKRFSNRSSVSLAKNISHWQDLVYGSRTNRLNTISGKFEPPEREVETFQNLYRGGIRYCDSLIEKLISELKSAGVWDETVLIVFGDHGDSFGEDGVFGHHFTTDESVIRVPLLIRDPTGEIQPGRVTDPVSLVDIYPTVLSLAGADAPENSGVDLTDSSRDESYVYYNVREHEYYTEAPQRGVRKDDLPSPTQHVIWRSSDERLTRYPHLDEYDSNSDRDRDLLRQLKSHTEELEDVVPEGQDLDKDVQERLEDMGYLRE